MRTRIALVGVMVCLSPVLAQADGYVAPRAKPVVLQPAGWTGLYAGVNAGYHWSGKDPVWVAPADPVTAAFWNPAIVAGAQPTSVGVGSDGFIGGGQIGYNWQISQFYVIGAEADFAWLDGGDGVTLANTRAGFVPNLTTATTDIETLGTVRARAGALLCPELLAYVTGGFAYGKVSHSFRGDFNATNDHFFGSTSKTETGWALGGGAEWALDRNWTLRGEYLHYDLGDSTFTTVGTGNAAGRGTFNAHADNTGNLVRGGLNFRF